MDVSLQRATEADLPLLLSWVGRYHEFEDISRTDTQREAALLPLLRDESLGAIWFMKLGEDVFGYLAICYSYSIEFGGRDCFIDEFFVDSLHRGHGLGRQVLELAVRELAALGIVAISLEVSRTNHAAEAFYSSCGFTPRSKYSLMTRLLS